MNKVKLLVAGLLVLPVFSLVTASTVAVSDVYAQPTSLQEGANVAQADGAPGELDGDSGVITNLINVFLYIIGIVSVIMLIFGGFLYITSAGNEAKVKSAKNTIVYAIIGLIIAIFAYAIINWVIQQSAGAA